MNIIIVKFNQPELEAQCIESVKQHTDPKHTLTVYDNYPKKENLSVVWNRLIEESEDEDICLLNNDTLVEAGWERMFEVINDPTVGAVGPVTNNCGGKQKNMPKADKVEEINDLSGFCYCFKKKVWRKVGKFPEDMPFYGQETVFNRKLQDHGYKLMVDRRVYVHHFKGQSWLKARDAGEVSDDNRTYGAFHYKNYVKRLAKLREIIPQGTRLVFLGAGAGNHYPTFRGIDQTISDYFGYNAIHLPMDSSADTILAFDPDILLVVNTRFQPEWYEEIRKVKRAGVKTALYWMDLRSPLRNDYKTKFDFPLDKHFDHIFFCAKGWVEEWQEYFKVPVHWLPQATIQHPIPPKDERHEVLMIGDVLDYRYHQNRLATINQLRDSQIKVTILNESARDKRIELSKRTYGLYGSANYCLSVSPLIEGYTSDRTYHILGAGGCMLMLDPGGMEHFKDHAFICKDAKQMIDIIRSGQRKTAFDYAQSEHLYKDRYITIIKTLCA